jgi:hypothetical protein
MTLTLTKEINRGDETITCKEPIEPSLMAQITQVRSKATRVKLLNLATERGIDESIVKQIINLEDSTLARSALTVKPIEQLIHVHEQRAAFYIMSFFTAFFAIEEKKKQKNFDGITIVDNKVYITELKSLGWEREADPCTDKNIAKRFHRQMQDVQNKIDDRNFYDNEVLVVMDIYSSFNSLEQRTEITPIAIEKLVTNYRKSTIAQINLIIRVLNKCDNSFVFRFDSML